MGEKSHVVELLEEVIKSATKLGAKVEKFLNPPISRASARKVFPLMDRFDPSIKELYQQHDGVNIRSKEYDCVAQLFLVPGWYWLPHDIAQVTQMQVEKFFPLLTCGGTSNRQLTTVLYDIHTFYYSLLCGKTR